MQILSSRHVKTEEASRLGVASGWYSTKISGTFVTGPHGSDEECLLKIAELNPPPPKPRPANARPAIKVVAAKDESDQPREIVIAAGAPVQADETAVVEDAASPVTMVPAQSPSEQ